ncbi:MAG TPA: hypothetical protein VFL94_15570 [Actinomycetales bacterium]|nr:hypothetical protein [Actinomycetales bacterium]
MWWYVAIAAGCAAMVPWARQRSQGSMTRYTVGTGAPLIFVLLSLAALVAAAAAASGDSDLARELFTGGLIGAALAQFILLRRTYGLGRRQDDDRPDERGADDDERTAAPAD